MQRATRPPPTIITSYVVATFIEDYAVGTVTEDQYTKQVTYASLTYDPALVSSSTQTTFYTVTRFGKGPDHPFIITVPVYTAEIPVIPTSSTTSTSPTLSTFATSTPEIVRRGGLSSAAIAGVTIGAAIAAILGLLLAFLLIRRRRQQRSPAPTRSQPPAVYPLERYKSSQSSSMTSFAYHGMNPAYMKEVEANQVL